MPKKRLGAEQIVTKLRQIEVLQGQGWRARRHARRSENSHRIFFALEVEGPSWMQCAQRSEFD